jgi:hypothetical protein
MIAAVLHTSRAASTPNPEPSTSGRPLLKSAGVIFLVALGIRLLIMFLIYTAPLGPDSPIWRTGPEMVKVVASIASQQGFSSPFRLPTGPTAWLPPVYPYLLASLRQKRSV